MSESNSPRPLGVGLISAGWMGRLHSRAYLAMRDKYSDLGVAPELIIVADPVTSNAIEFQEHFGFKVVTDDYRAVLGHPDVDVVSICAPNYLHRDFAVAAAQAGKPFWIEKPMGISRAQSADIVAAAQANGLPTCVGFTYRGAPAIVRAHDLLRSGALGAITNVHVKLNADYSADPTGPRTWRFVRETGGSGVLGDLLSHGFDLAQYLTGSPIAEVSALISTFIDQRPAPGGGTGHQVHAAPDAAMLPVENEDYASVIARFASGVVGTFESSRVAVGSRCDYGVEVHCTGGAIRWNFERLNELDICAGDTLRDYGYTTEMSDERFGDFARFQPGAGMGLSFDDLKVIEGSQFVRSVLTHTQLAPSVADGLAAASTVDAALRSASSATWVKVPAPNAGTTFED
ncbi:MAG: Gfo/Idh/MocA family oxidoreductase [Bifidobacteriaceae bacterium]|nr:Gfo/Idh/MocA family oxidoreductase [Bifidobacteriaceae bacterium]